MSRKKLLLVQVVAVCFLSLIFLDKVTAASKSWEYVQFGGSTGFEYLTFVDENRIVAATTGRPYYISGGDISLSTDGGKSWSKTLQNVPANTQKIRFLNSQVGFAVGGGEGYGVAMYLGKTTDGGNTWTDFSDDFIKSVKSSIYIPLYGLWVVDSSKIYVSSGSQVYVSANGGTSWSQAGDINAINPDKSIHGNLHFATSNAGFVSSRNYLFRTQNGGSSWEKLTPPWNYDASLELYSLKFLDANNGWALVVDTAISTSNPLNPAGYGSLLYRTTNGGQSWSLVYQWVYKSDESGPYPEALYVKSANDIWVGGWEEIWHSSNGGATWTLENEGNLYIRVWGFQMVGSESAPRAIASSGMTGTSIYGYYKYLGTTTSLPDICCGMEGGASVNGGSYLAEVNLGQTDKVDIKAAISSSVTGTGDIYVVLYWEGFYFFKIGDPDLWWTYDGTKVIPYKEAVSLAGYPLDIYSGLLTGLKGDLFVFVVYWKQGAADPVISDPPIVIHMK